jgi:hypothetical protein
MVFEILLLFKLVFILAYIFGEKKEDKSIHRYSNETVNTTPKSVYI